MTEASTLEDRLKDIEKGTLADLNQRIAALLQDKQQAALAGGFAAGTIAAAVVGGSRFRRKKWQRRKELLALGAGLVTSLLTSRILLAAQLR